MRAFMISFILPNRNEKKVHEVISGIEALGYECEIIVAVDRDSRGKGWAIREAFNHSKGDIVCFLDADGDIDPKMVRRIIPHLEEFDIVVGKKDTKGRFSRYILTICSRIFIYILFKIPVDTQTGIKVFKRSALPGWECNGWAFDIEILAKAKKAGFSMFEVTIDAVSTRRMKLKSIWNTFISTLKIWREVNYGLHKRKKSRES